MPTQNLLKFISVANVDDENRVGNNLMQTWELKFIQTVSTRFVQGFDVEVQARFLSLCLVNILPLMFCRGYEVES